MEAPLVSAAMDTVRRDVRLPHTSLSVVVPAFNQEAEVAGMIAATAEVLHDAGIPAEVIVVDDGSTDGTRDAAASAPSPIPLSVLSYPRNRGKGYALTTGSRAAAGEWIAWIDADLDLHPSHLPLMLTKAKATTADALVGSKRHPASVVNYPLRRQIFSALYQGLIRLLFKFNVRDTQVGLKVFHRPVLDIVLPHVLVKRYAFDVEVLALARHFGFTRIYESPIHLTYQFSGTNLDLAAIGRSLWDTAAIFYRMHITRTYDR